MFTKAKRIWLRGLTEEMNVQARFVAKLPKAADAKLYMTGATFYKVYLDGKIIHHGPAPTATGYARIDVIDLPALSVKGVTLSVEVAGYACNSYATVKQKSYLIAEVRSGDDVIAATGADFEAFRVLAREQKCIKYSHQRHFTEVWDLDRRDEKCEIEILDDTIEYLPRRAPLPTIEEEVPSGALCIGKFTVADRYNKDNLDTISYNLNTNIATYSFDEVEKLPFTDFQNLDYEFKKEPCETPERLSSGEFALFECERNSSGLVHLEFIAEEGTRILIAFDEWIEDGKFPFALKVANVIELCGSGDVSFENFDIYGYKYYSVFVLSGSVDLKRVCKMNIRHSPKNIAPLNTDDRELLDIYDAALESYRCNSLGIFMDCPTRERAGWLCDSLFIARASYAITGSTDIEEDFLENYVNHKCKTIPEGMIPMCYPSEHASGRFIPQWSMWFILQVEEYVKRKPDADLSKFKDTIYGLLNYFAKFENEYSLLEDLESWNFVEWSQANKWCDGVNFPTNMLYAKTLITVDKMFSDPALSEKAERIRRNVREMSFDGKFFHDQALRDENGKLAINDNISEVCQYYAFYFDTVDDDEYSELKERMINEFGPDIDNYPNIEKVNAFMGMYLRIELFREWGLSEKLLRDLKDFFLGMARLTGTLWEHKNTRASLNHGFPSYTVPVLRELINKD